MKKIIAWLLVVALTAAISIGATLAYLTDTDEDVNVMTLGKVKIDQLEYERVDVESKDDNATVQEFHDNKPLLPAVTDKDFTYIPGDTYVDWDQIGKDGYTSEIWNPEKINNEVDKMVFIKNKGDYDAYVRSVFAFEAGKYATLAEFQQMVHLNLNETDYTWEWVETPVEIPNAEGGTTKYFVATATYNKILAPGALTEISLSQIALDKTATNEDVEAFGDTYQILVKTQGIQADGFDTADFALDEGFGEISAANIPFESDAPTKGIDIITALNTYKGETITTKVQSIVFGKNADYPEIVAGDKGLLMDVEQDVPANVYYVENNGLYQIYILSNDVIYAPTDCSNMCNGMSNLVSVDTSNLDVSRTTSMYRMFRDCGKLAQIDVSDWDTANVTNMRDLFRGCKSLPSVDVSNWKTGKVETLIATFQDCILMTEIDVSKWDTSNVTDMTQTFNRCNGLKTLDVSKWDTSNVTSMQLMFQECLVLPTLDVSNWNTGKVTSMGGMFRGTYALQALDVGDWDVSKVENFSQIFASGHQNKGDMKFTTLDVSKWNTSSATNMGSLFYGCGKLTELDLSNWDVSHVTNMSHMFADCFKLQSINFTGWNTESLVVMDATFNDCDGLVTLDVSDFDTHNVKEFCQVFDDCEKLEQIIGLENWNTTSGCSFEEMFQGCDKLPALNLSSFNTANARDNFKGASDTYHAFVSMFANTNNLQTLIIGKDFDFDGNSTANRRVQFPNPAAKAGLVAMWRNVETGERYLAKDIPEGVAATYVADYEYTAKGATMKDALHYLNADPTGTKITAKVSNVIVGKTSEYAEIVNTYTGVLADQEQDGPVYAYYVPNGSNNYDVYILSENDIYAPADCYELFYNGEAMASLKSVDLSNLNTSRTTNMARMFRNCTALTSLDISGLDTGAVTDMSYMIYNCSALKTVNATGLNTGNVTTMANMFRNCSALTDVVGAKGWNVSKVTDMNSMFRKCTALTTVDLAGWNAASLTTMPYIFRDCSKLVSADLSGWNVSNVTNMESLFDTCGALTTVITTGWDTSKVENLSYAFYDCGNLTTLDVSGWNTGSLKNLDQTFFGCKKLATLDVSGWDTQNVDFLYATFYNCSSLTALDVSNWNTAKVTNMNSLFTNCSSLTALDVSDWDTGNVTNMSQMFMEASALGAVDVSKWNVSKVTDMRNMFYHCAALQYVDMSNWNVSKVTTFNGMFALCGNLQTAKADNWKPDSATSFVSMFHDCVKLQGFNAKGWQLPKLLTASHMFRGCNSATVIDVSGWYTPSLTSMDGMFHTCKAMTTVDLSSFDTSKCLEMSQIFDHATGLQYVIGLDKLNTSSAKTFEEAFAGCSSLKVLDLSSFNTKNVEDAYYPMQNNSTGHGFLNMLTGMTGLEKLIIGEGVVFNGNGSVSDTNRMKLPAPAAKAGFTAKWRNVETGELFDASQIPEKVAATYEAHYIANT